MVCPPSTRSSFVPWACCSTGPAGVMPWNAQGSGACLSLIALQCLGRGVGSIACELCQATDDGLQADIARSLVQTEGVSWSQSQNAKLTVEPLNRV